MRRTLILILLVALASTFVACSSSGGDDATGTDDPMSTDDLGTDDPGTDDPGTDDPGTDDPGGPGSWGDLVAADLEFRPVLARSMCTDDAPTTAPGAGADGETGFRQGQVEPTTTTPLGPDMERLPSTDGSTCYDLGPVGATGADLATAEAEDQQEWVVTVAVRDESRSALNALFNACYDATEKCPAVAEGRGAVAIVFGDTVVSAPTVFGADLADDEFTISGAFTEEEAKDLAEILSD